ncbi:hypothetical protein WR25_18796 isoform B [Diploscapter pachys]|uniref:Galectin n=1 Tax=Diploscapter pachys TaxID=2018661 RepID=A0A2A2J8E2_9BILA|nr:hypothetical protein WR25_18796 isoform B [Diploscapter pachys]
MAGPQRFPLPTMPFRKEIHSGCSVGTSIMIRGKPYDDRSKSFLVQFNTKNDIALNLTFRIGSRGQILANSRIGSTFTSELSKSEDVSLNKKFTLHIKVEEDAYEIFYNGEKALEFVHRVLPTEVFQVFIEGPLILDEVVFSPPDGASSMPAPASQYQRVSSAVPLPDMDSLNISDGPNRPYAARNAPTYDHPASTAYSRSPGEDFPPPPDNLRPEVFHRGGPQGFSEHPYPLPGLFDQPGEYPERREPPTMQIVQPMLQTPVPQPSSSSTRPSQPPYNPDHYKIPPPPVELPVKFFIRNKLA